MTQQTSRFSAEEIEQAIIAALKVPDIEAAAGLIHKLAAVDPDKAELISNAVHLIAGMPR